MSIARIFIFAIAALLATSAFAHAQVPEELRAAMQARDLMSQVTTAKP
jgi:hypothetical protein